MINIDEVEDFYKKDIEKLDKEFLTKIKTANQEQKNLLDKEYRTKAKLIRSNYEKRYAQYVKEQKDRIKKDLEKKRNFRPKTEKNKILEIKTIDIRQDEKDKFNRKWENFKFKSLFKLHNLLNYITPNSWITYRIRLRLTKKMTFASIDSWKSRTSNRIRLRSIKFFQNSIYIIKKTISIIKNIITFPFRLLRKLFKRKKDNKNQVEKRPDELIAEKLLNADKEES